MSDELSDLIDEMVVFGFEDGTYASNSPYWNDSRIRKAWIKKHGKKNEPVVPEPVVEDTEEEVEDYNSYNVDELRTELAGRGLSVDGKKADLIARLEENDAAEE